MAVYGSVPNCIITNAVMSDEKNGSMLMVPEMTIDEHWASVNRPFLIAKGTAAEGQSCWILTQTVKGGNCLARLTLSTEGLVAKVERHRAQRGVDGDGINNAARIGHLTLGEHGLHSGSSLLSSRDPACRQD